MDKIAAFVVDFFIPRYSTLSVMYRTRFPNLVHKEGGWAWNTILPVSSIR